MGEIGQSIDHRASAVLGQFGDGLVLIGANHDDVDILAQHAAEVGDALALPKPTS